MAENQDHDEQLDQVDQNFVAPKTDLEDKMEKNELESGEPTVEELVEFCQKRWEFSEDEISQVVESGDFASAIANASLIAQENHETTDEEFFAALAEAGLME